MHSLTNCRLSSTEFPRIHRFRVTLGWLEQVSDFNRKSVCIYSGERSLCLTFGMHYKFDNEKSQLCSKSFGYVHRPFWRCIQMPDCRSLSGSISRRVLFPLKFSVIFFPRMNDRVSVDWIDGVDAHHHYYRSLKSLGLQWLNSDFLYVPNFLENIYMPQPWDAEAYKLVNHIESLDDPCHRSSGRYYVYNNYWYDIIVWKTCARLW